MFGAVDDLLRVRGRHAAGAPLVWRELVVVFVVAGFGYGAVMGAFDGRPLQMLWSGLKVPLLLGVTTLLVLPTFFVLSTVLGLRDDFLAALRAVVGSQSVFAICLGSLAPFTAVVYASGMPYAWTSTFHGGMFLLATLGAQWTLARHYRPLERRAPRHRIAKRAWMLLYVFVAIQMAWVLRPFIGDPGMPTRFLREGAWSNAYVAVFETVMRLVS